MCLPQKNVLQDEQRDHVWNLEGFYALVLFFTIFIIVTTCLMVICDYSYTETGTTATAQSYRCVFTFAACCSVVIVPHGGAHEEDMIFNDIVAVTLVLSVHLCPRGGAVSR